MEELSAFRADTLVLVMRSKKTPAQVQWFANELYETAAEIERDHAGRLGERLGAPRGGAIDADTGLITRGPRSTVGEAVRLIRLAADWHQEAARLGFSVESP